MSSAQRQLAGPAGRYKKTKTKRLNILVLFWCLFTHDTWDIAGNYADYVESAKSNDSFIIAKTLQITDKRPDYWIIDKGFSINNCDKINCDSIIQSHVIRPLEYSVFETKVSQLK